jgi:hypothetical protein
LMFLRLSVCDLSKKKRKQKVHSTCSIRFHKHNFCWTIVLPYLSTQKIKEKNGTKKDTMNYPICGSIQYMGTNSSTCVAISRSA